MTTRTMKTKDLGTLTGVFGVLLTTSCNTPGSAQNCPATYKDLANQGASSTECACPAGAGQGGTVWGSGVYTTDSSICAAAVHAGAVGASGGSVTLKKSAGCAKYNGTTANGVTTSSWGSFESSFYFAGKGDGSCAK